MMDCPCDLTRIAEDQEWLHRQWHAFNPGVRPTPWEAPRPPIYHRYPPGPLMQRLCITFPLQDGRFISYPRQETPMPTARAADPAPALATLYTEFHAAVLVYLEAKLHEGARERHIQELWDAIKRLEDGGAANE